MENRSINSSSMQTEKYKSIRTAWGMTIIFLLIFILNIIYHSGEAGVTVQLFYIPILISVIVFGIKAGILTAFFAGISVKPLMMLFISSNTAIVNFLWATQTSMFLVGAFLFGIIIKFFNNLKEIIKVAPYESIQTGINNELKVSFNNITKTIKYLNISFEIFEYKNFNFINSYRNCISGKKVYELIIVDKHNSSLNELNEKMAS